MVKVEDIQQYGKEHLETVVASATTLQNGIQAIATAYGDYTKKSFEDTKSFVEKLSGVKSLDKAIEVQTEFAKSAYETFVAELQKIAGLYTDLAKQTFKPFEGMVAKFSPAAAHCTQASKIVFQKSKSPAVTAGLFSCSELSELILRRAAWRSARGRSGMHQQSDRSAVIIWKLPSVAQSSSTFDFASLLPMLT